MLWRVSDHPVNDRIARAHLYTAPKAPRPMSSPSCYIDSIEYQSELSLLTLLSFPSLKSALFITDMIRQGCSLGRTDAARVAVTVMAVSMSMYRHRFSSLARTDEQLGISI